MIDPVSVITGAIIAGASVAAKETASSAVKDAYAGLKRLVADVYKIASVAMLEKEPSKPLYREAVREEISSAHELTSDLQAVKFSIDLLNAISSEPKESLEGWGLVARHMEASADVILNNIFGTRGGVQTDTIVSKEGGIHISNIGVRSSSGN